MTDLAHRLGLTPAGCWLLLGAGLTGLAGWLLGWVEFRLAAVSALVVLALAVLFTLGRQAYAISLDLAGNRVVVGEPAHGRLLVTNTSSGRTLPTRIDLPVGPRTASVGVPSLAGRVTHVEVFALPTQRRARLIIGPARSVRADPFSLFARSVTWTEEQELIVHPRTVRLAGRRGGFVRDLEGHSTEELASSDVSFHALRDYVSGDDRRHVHWRSSARAQKLLVRQFTETRRSEVAVGLDLDPAAWADPEEFETGVSVAASIALEALADDNPLVLVAGQDELPASSATRALDALSGIGAGAGAGEGDEGAAPLARRVERAAPGASVVCLVTGSATDAVHLRRAMALFGPDVRVLAVRVAAEPVLVQTTGRNTTATLPTLAELPAAMRRAVRG